MKTDILVIGAGPAGLLTSIFIDKYDVLIIEEHRDVGLPKHCAGFISKYTIDLITPLVGGDIVDNKYSSTIFYIFNKKYIVDFKEPFVYRINRPLLEQKLLDIVYSKGHNVLLSTRGKPTYSLDKITTNREDIYCSKIVVADGSKSIFRKFFYRKILDKLIGVQYVYRTSCLDTDTIHLIYNNHTPDFFQWLAPLDRDTVLIGFATRRYSTHPDVIVNKITRETNINLGSKIEVFGGLIPFDKPMKKPIYREKLFFIGDSIPIIKPYTGGGLLNIFTLAPALGYSITTGDIGVFVKIYDLIRARIIYEYLAVSVFRKIGYWIPPRIVYSLYKWNMLKPSDYDNHYSLLSKSLKLIPHILLDIFVES